MSERIPQVPQVSGHRIRSRRFHGTMAGTKLVASREVGLKRREERKTMRSQDYTETHKDQRDDKGTGNGGGRQKLKHVDGGWCKRRKSEDKKQQRENEISKGKGRHVDGDIPLSMRRSQGQQQRQQQKKTAEA